jgi:hypothetical protein
MLLEQAMAIARPKIAAAIAEAKAAAEVDRVAQEAVKAAEVKGDLFEPTVSVMRLHVRTCGIATPMADLTKDALDYSHMLRDMLSGRGTSHKSDRTERKRSR